MPVATITSKGQITVPQAVREQLGLHSGDKVDFVSDENGGFKMIPLRRPRGGSRERSGHE
jgi:antitoxin PrlF